MMKSSLGSFLSVLLALLSSPDATVMAQTCVASQFGAFSLDNLQCFVVTDSAKFTCGQEGSRISYGTNDFSVLPVIEGGGNVQTAQGSLWTVEDATNDFVELAGCISGSCVVRGLLDCECEAANGQPCATTTAAPTPAPVAGPTQEFPVCPKQTATQNCKQLLENPTAVFESTFGIDPDCDCYNFCNGKFISCCTELTGNCGDTTCTSEADDGEVEGLILGCHVGHLQDPNQIEPRGDTGDDDDDSGDSGAAGRSSMVLGTTLLVMGMGLMAALVL